MKSRKDCIFCHWLFDHFSSNSQKTILHMLHQIRGLNSLSLTGGYSRLWRRVVVLRQILSPWLGGKVDSGLGLSYCHTGVNFIPPVRDKEFGYWSARLHGLGDRYDNTRPESTKSVSHGLRICPLSYSILVETQVSIYWGLLRQQLSSK